jgi:hypothetical protein
MGQAAPDVLKGYTFARLSSPPRYKEVQAEQLKAALEPWKDGTKLSRAIAKTLTVAEVRAMINGVPEEVETEDDESWS